MVIALQNECAGSADRGWAIFHTQTCPMWVYCVCALYQYLYIIIHQNAVIVSTADCGILKGKSVGLRIVIHISLYTIDNAEVIAVIPSHGHTGNLDAILVRLNHHNVGDLLSVLRHSMQAGWESSASGLGDGASVKNDVLEVADRTVAASSLNVSVAHDELLTTLAIISSYAI